MRTTLYGLVEALASAVTLPEPVVEVGSRRVLGQSNRPSLRESLPGKHYLGVDMLPGPGVDRVADVRALPFTDDEVGTVLILDAIEHVSKPFEATAELRRCLADDGLLLMTSVFHFPIHETPGDYWRFTAMGFASLLDDFPKARCWEVGPTKLPHTVVGLAGGPGVDPGAWDRACAAVDTWAATGAITWRERALDVLPPPLLVTGYDLTQRLTLLSSRRWRRG